MRLCSRFYIGLREAPLTGTLSGWLAGVIEGSDAANEDSAAAAAFGEVMVEENYHWHSRQDIEPAFMSEVRPTDNTSEMCFCCSLQ